MNAITRREPNEPQTQSTSAPVANYRKPWYEVETEGEVFTVRVFLPGVSREGVELNYERETLTVTGHRTHRPAESWKPLVREIRDEDFRLRLALNVEIQGDRIQAQIEDGVLTINLPKAESIKPRLITVA